MTPNISIALGAGLISAIAFASATTGATVTRMIMLAIVTLPIALAGYSYNAATGFLAAAVGTFIIIVLTTFGAGIAFATTLAFPAAFLVYLALLNREPAPGVAEWYPVGRILVATALIAATVVALGLVMADSTPDKLRAAVSAAIETMMKTGFGGAPGGPTLSQADLARFTDIMVKLLPGVSAVFWMACILFCQWAAARVALASGQLVRPWPDLAAFRLPPGTPALLGLSLAATLVLDDMPQLMALGFAGATYSLYVLLGLAVIHYMTRGASWRGPALTAIYALLIIFNSGASLLLAVLGLAGSFVELRRPDGSNNSNSNS
ncbi:MAG: DUF2232 domain-containing protein [Hyphomicrobiaceae bacterium]